MTAKKALVSLLAMATFGVLSPAQAQSDGVRPCYRAKLQEGPRWISTATWVEKLSSILLVDPLSNKLMLVSPEGKTTYVHDPPAAIEPSFQPASIVSTSSGFLLKLLGTRFLPLSENLAFSRASNLSKLGPDGQLGSVYQWTMAGSDIFAYGSLAKKDESFSLGFLRVPSAQPSRAKMVKLWPNGDYYALGYPMLASVGSDGYFLFMDAQPAIYRSEPTKREASRLSAFPKEFSNKIPPFTSVMTGPSTAGARFAELSTFSIPTGLYSQNGFLYVLARQPSVRSATWWWLYKFDPVADRVLGRVKLPTEAPHLTLVPGKDRWYLIERGAVGEMQQQKIENLVSLSSAAIEALSLPTSCPSL